MKSSPAPMSRRRKEEWTAQRGETRAFPLHNRCIVEYGKHASQYLGSSKADLSHVGKLLYTCKSIIGFFFCENFLLSLSLSSPSHTLTPFSPSSLSLKFVLRFVSPHEQG